MLCGKIMFLKIVAANLFVKERIAVAYSSHVASVLIVATLSSIKYVCDLSSAIFFVE